MLTLTALTAWMLLGSLPCPPLGSGFPIRPMPAMRYEVARPAPDAEGSLPVFEEEGGETGTAAVQKVGAKGADPARSIRPAGAKAAPNGESAVTENPKSSGSKPEPTGDPVPEPLTLAMVGSGLIALAFYRKRGAPGIEEEREDT